MKLSEHKDLKAEILALPAKEKDKLLLRLVAKDQVLTEHLHFLLLESEVDLTERIEKIKTVITDEAAILNANHRLNAKETLTSLRKLAKLVNHFYKVTKSAFYEVELRLFMLNNIPVVFKFSMPSRLWNFDDKFAQYYVRATQVTLNKFNKLHDDMQFDLSETMDCTLETAFKNFKKGAERLALPKQV